MRKSVAILTTAIAISCIAVVSCSKANKKTKKTSESVSTASANLVASREAFQSRFVQEWIDLLQAPRLAITKDELTALCSRESISLDLGTSSPCDRTVDLNLISDQFEAGCVGPSSLYLKLRPKSTCTTSTLALLRQRKSTGPLILKSGAGKTNLLEANAKDFPVLAELPPLMFEKSESPQIDIPSSDVWLKSMSPNGAVRVMLRPTKNLPRSLEPVARILSEIETPKKFSPSIRIASGAIAQPNITSIQISWVDGPDKDRASNDICNLVTGWIDYQLLQTRKKPAQTTYELQCTLELETTASAINTGNDIEIGRLNFPLVWTKTGAFLFSTLSESLTPSALLGLRLDL